VKKKLLFLVNVDWFFLSHRLPIAIEAQHQGYEVHVVTGITDKFDVLESYGFIVHPWSIGRSSTGLAGEALTFWEIFKVFKKVQPHIVHLVTIKSVIFGGIAARLTGVPSVVAAISGLGFVFLNKGLKAAVIRSVVSGLYRLALGKRNLNVICQNVDDLKTIVKVSGISRNKVVMILGSGVELSSYRVKPLPQGTPIVVMAARLLLDKGVYDFITAARLLKKRGIVVRFLLAGEPDPGNPATITQKEFSNWDKESCIELLGYRDDIANLFSQSTVVVLPSYYGEGLPKVLVEAAACGRAVVTTDHPGCRDAVEPGKSGILVPVKDPVALADAIQHLIVDSELCQSMGLAGRSLAEREFDIERIVNAHLKIYRELVNRA
jgi:glycosyltransferase involved in cell wall biosynthesis